MSRLRFCCVQKTSNRIVGGPVSGITSTLSYFCYNVVVMVGAGRGAPKYGLVGAAVAAMVVGARSVWVAGEADGTVRRASPTNNRVTRKIKVGTTPNGVVYAFGSVWVADLGRGSLVRIDVKTSGVTAKIGIRGADWIT